MAMPARHSDRSKPELQPTADDNDPLGQLYVCHERMIRQINILDRLCDRLAAPQTAPDKAPAAAPAGDVDPEVRAAARGIQRYFDEVAPRHHLDEEQDLFPAVIESMAGSDARCLHELTAQLVREHRRLEADWAALRPMIATLAQGRRIDLDPRVVATFVANHRTHLSKENDELMPMARRLLSDQQVAEIGANMRQRRDRAKGHS